jgi:hypothetical protein
MGAVLLIRMFGTSVFCHPLGRVSLTIPRKVGMSGMDGFSRIDGFRGMDGFIWAITLAGPVRCCPTTRGLPITTLATATHAEAETRSGHRGDHPPAST